ncbi:mechanosensitive ion channel family protein [Euzebyella marina]|uniref:Mechanosensitive ion channel family protein n=1 Tax=Euzebyella marina TaxID=1761453 RepID=A0A3G2L7R7_9FLAO|nr:mechanosensitive ion channel family protein [Euzebyella marina]AYN68322.1 mechanosensitive ion channel family protein [Euzebyella marina]MAU72872.1 mechanosensitive ion channel protein MscS [Pseudozobellia sp.]MBG48534.1 mechanosensitive ion channel protein MscS [Pseudozobellia sp.]MBG50587.1 mechanosensitive ion channel protein MscS [Pseudozobellia sp.]|tara:strand:+ start:244 stop:789 length:546 start_codon:yes stop_codon:yes gene_type:complete
MEEFLSSYKNEFLATIITLVVIIFLKYLLDKTIRKIGRISNIAEPRTVLISKYVSGLLTIIGLGIIFFIWGFDYKEVGLVFSSVFAVIGVALFASWSILSNVTAGVVLFFSFPFKIGDRVKILDKEINSDEAYLIEDIKAFHVSLRKENGELLVYPNNLLMQKAVTLVYNLEETPDGTEET